MSLQSLITRLRAIEEKAPLAPWTGLKEYICYKGQPEFGAEIIAYAEEDAHFIRTTRNVFPILLEIIEAQAGIIDAVYSNDGLNAAQSYREHEISQLADKALGLMGETEGKE